MATSGNWTGSRTVSNGPQLRLLWERLSVDIPNNRSRIRLTLQIYSQYHISFSANKSGKLQGAGFTYTGGMIGTGYKTVRTSDIWVNHNSDGTRSVTFSGELSINVSWSTGYVSKLTVSGSATLDTIPRASTLNSFGSFSVRPNQSNPFSLSISRATSSFTHDISLVINNETIQTWNGQGLPTTLSIGSSQSNRILNILRDATTITAQLRVQTKSGSTRIGGVLTRNATASVHSSESPEISGVSISDNSSDYANDLGVYVQSKTRLSISLATSAGYGARDGSFKVTVDGRSYTSKSFTSNIINGSGSLVISIEYVNSRNQKVVTTRTITVYQYFNPRPRIVRSYRSDGNGIADEGGEFGTIEYTAEIASLNNTNTKNFKARYKRSDSIGFEEEDLSNATYKIEGSVTFLADEDYSYEVQIVASDYFTTREAYGDVLSTFTLMNFAADGKGIAFGGTYDETTGGIVQFNGNVYFEGSRPTTLSDYKSSVNGGSNEVILEERGIYLVVVAPSGGNPKVAMVTKWSDTQVYINEINPGFASTTVTVDGGNIRVGLSSSGWYQYSVTKLY